jgi:DNA-binding GntR family transcriptional regulator
VSRSSLAEAAYVELRTAIVGRRLAPRTPVIETEFAEMLGVSRTPVREALLRLELEGYLVRDGSGRLLVHGYSSKEITDLFLVREALEGHAALLAASRISDAELDELDRLYAEDIEAFQHHRIDQLAALNDRIHGIILEGSRNRTLRDLVADLRQRIHGLTLFAVGGGADQQRFVEEHGEMTRLLRVGDGERLEALMRRHVRQARDVLLEGLGENNASWAVDPTAATPGAGRVAT